MLNLQIVGVIVRLFAAWLATWALRHIPIFWLSDTSGLGSGVRLYALAIPVAALLIAVLLWLFPLAIAKKIIPGPSSVAPPLLSTEQLQCAGASLLGLWVLVSAIPNAGYAVVVASTRETLLDGAGYAALVHLAIEVGLGIWLLFGARGLLRLVRMARDVY